MLTQNDIDAPVPLPTKQTWRQYLAICPGGISTLILLAAFALGMWGLWLIWNTGHAVSTAVRG